MSRKIYVASSWRNQLQPSVVELLREFGHEVYDFRDHGFGWRQTGVLVSSITGYLKAMSTEIAIAGFSRDKAALDWCDTCILVLPCGRSAHLEAGYAAGQGKEVYFLLSEVGFEPELMYLLGTRCATDITQILEWIQDGRKG